MRSEEWARVHILHDVDVKRSNKWPATSVNTTHVVQRLSKVAAGIVRQVAAAAGIKDRG